MWIEEAGEFDPTMGYCGPQNKWGPGDQNQDKAGAQPQVNRNLQSQEQSMKSGYPFISQHHLKTGTIHEEWIPIHFMASFKDGDLHSLILLPSGI